MSCGAPLEMQTVSTLARVLYSMHLSPMRVVFQIALTMSQVHKDSQTANNFFKTSVLVYET